MTDAKDPDDNSSLRQAMFQVSDGVIGAAILVVLGVFLGRWLDDHFHTTPFALVGCALLGGGLGLARLVQKALLIGQDPANKKKPG